jgi:cobalt-zinc-cadmium resistance protein CzcA
VEHIVTQLGRNDDGTDPFTPSHIESAVTLHPYSSWKSGWDKQTLIARMARRFERIPGIDVGFSQPMIDGVYDKIAGAHSELVVKVYGEDFAELRRIAQEVVQNLEKIPGSADVAIDQEPPLPQVRITLDRDAAARYGLNADDVSGLISSGISGGPLAQIFVGERVYDVALRISSEWRDDPAKIGNLLLATPSGAQVALSQIASIELRSGESTITREMGRRHLTVKLNLRGRDLGSFLKEARPGLEQAIQYDRQKYQIVWGGQFENQQRSQRRLMLVVPAALALMFVLLFGAFRTLRHPLLILSTVPLAAVGGLAALVVRGMTLNVSSAVGFIALFGVAIQNGIIMVANLNRWRELDQTLLQAVMKGARQRFRPVLIAATVATVGLIPAALTHAVGSDVQRPLATVIIGGMITATALTLILLPALYFLVEAWAQRRMKAHPPEVDRSLEELLTEGK